MRSRLTFMLTFLTFSLYGAGISILASGVWRTTHALFAIAILLMALSIWCDSERTRLLKGEK